MMLTWLLLSELALLPLIAILVNLWLARRRRRKRLQTLEQLLERLKQSENGRLAALSERLAHHVRGDSIELEAIARRWLDSEKAFIRDLLPLLVNDDDTVLERLDEALYRLLDERWPNVDLEWHATRPLTPTPATPAIPATEPPPKEAEGVTDGQHHDDIAAPALAAFASPVWAETDLGAAPSSMKPTAPSLAAEQNGDKERAADLAVPAEAPPQTLASQTRSPLADKNAPLNDLDLSVWNELETLAQQEVEGEKNLNASTPSAEQQEQAAPAEHPDQE